MNLWILIISYFVIGYLLCWFTWNLMLARVNKKRTQRKGHGIHGEYDDPLPPVDKFGITDVPESQGMWFFFSMIGFFPFLIVVWISLIHEGRKISERPSILRTLNKPMRFLAQEIIDPKNNVKDQT